MNPIDLLKLLANLQKGISQLAVNVLFERKQLAGQFPQVPEIHEALAATDAIFSDVSAKIQAQIDGLKITDDDRLEYVGAVETEVKAVVKASAAVFAVKAVSADAALAEVAEVKVR